MNEQMYDKIVECIKKSLEHPVLDIQPEYRLQEDLGMNSLELVNLQIALEEEFLVLFDPIEDDFYQIFQSVQSVCLYVEEHVDE